MKRFIAIVLCAIMLALAGCTPEAPEPAESTQAPTEAPAGLQAGGTLKLQMRTPDTYHPLLTKQNSCAKIYGLLFDSLLNIGEGMQLEPNLAKAWSTMDGKTFVLQLDSGATWHDGKPFTAQDAAYSLQFIQSNDTVYTSLLADVAYIDAQSDTTLCISLNNPNYGFLHTLTFPIVREGAPDLCGTGQFRFRELIDNQKMVLEKNTAYHLGAPHIETVEVSLFSSTETAIAAFEANEIDAMAADTIDFSKFSAKDYMQWADYPTNSYEFLGMNHEKILFQNEAFRNAVSAAIDRRAIANGAIIDRVVPANVPVNPQSLWYEPELDSTAQKQEQAKTALAEAGFTDANGNGILEYEQTDIHLEILINEEDAQKKSEADLIAAQLKAVGLECRIDSVSSEAFTQRLADGEFDMFIACVEFSNPYDLAFLFGTGGSQNVLRYASNVMDLRLETMRGATNEEQFSEEVRKFTRFFNQNQPVIGLNYKMGSVLYNQKIAEISVYGPSVFSHVYTWYVNRAE